MNLDSLRNYKNWVGKSPGEILEAVKDKKIGGWKKVFTKEAFDESPTGLPRWAHRIRNFFNQEPNFLNHVDDGGFAYNLRNVNFKKTLKENFALSGDVYRDEFYNKWLQMSPGGAVYHFKHNYGIVTAAAIYTKLGQTLTPVFKLISPDGSGGSRETIINNPLQITRDFLGNLTALGQSTIGDGEMVKVTSRVMKIALYQGSYNYGETVDAGESYHEKFDVKPHEKDEIGYIAVEDRFSSLFSRKFPERANGEQTPLAEQEDYKKYP